VPALRFAGPLQRLSTAPGCGHRVATVLASSRGVSFSFRVLASPAVVPYWFGTPPSPFELTRQGLAALDPGVVPLVALCPKIGSGLYPLVELRLLQSITRPCCHSARGTCVLRRRDTSHGVCLPSTFEEGRVHLSGVCLTPYVALPGFLTLSALYSPPNRPALFHAGDVLGVLPFRAFPSRGAVPPLGGLLPS
jgi:hypothetical protein